MKSVIKAVIAGSIIIAVGIIVLIITLAVNGWSFKQPSYEMQSYEAESEVSALDIELDAGSVKVEFYDGDKVTIDYPSSRASKNEIKENGGTLNFSTKTKHIISFGKLKIPETTVRIPQSTVIDFKLDMDAGAANISAGAYRTVTLDVDAGTVTFNGGTCESVKVDLDAGSVKINGVTSERLDCEIDAGSLNVDGVTCPYARIDVDAGSASIKFTGAQAEYTIDRKLSAGSCNVGAQSGSTDKKIDLDVSAGSVKLYFAD